MSDELLMPFLPVQSRGGPHNDDAYSAGFEMGRFDGLLQAGWWPENHPLPIHGENREQADLIAMQYGYTAEITDETEGWINMTVHRND